MSDLLSLHEAMARLRAVGYIVTIEGKRLNCEQSRRGTKTIDFITIANGKVLAAEVRRIQSSRKFS